MASPFHPPFPLPATRSPLQHQKKRGRDLDSLGRVDNSSPQLDVCLSESLLFKRNSVGSASISSLCVESGEDDEYRYREELEGCEIDGDEFSIVEIVDDSPGVELVPSEKKLFIHQYFSFRRPHGPTCSSSKEPTGGSSEGEEPMAVDALCRSCRCSLTDQSAFCSYCTHSICLASCTIVCEGCKEFFCKMCSTINYDRSEERMFCLDCNR